MLNNDLDTVPKRTRHARKEAGFKSQASIAKEIGITREAYAWYETTTSVPSEHLAKFCVSTKINVEWLLTGKGERQKTPITDEWASNQLPALRNLHESSQGLFEELLNQLPQKGKE